MKIYLPVKLNEIEKKAVWDILCEVDSEFVPSLSSRCSTRQTFFSDSGINMEGPIEYYKQTLKQEFILAETDSEIVGLISFINGYKNDSLNNNWQPSNYISTVSVKRHLGTRKFASKCMSFC